MTPRKPGCPWCGSRDLYIVDSGTTASTPTFGSDPQKVRLRVTCGACGACGPLRTRDLVESIETPVSEELILEFTMAPKEEPVTPERHPLHVFAQKARLLELDPVDESHIFIEDIANALSHICRFGGHTIWPYSVAQHSIMVADELLRRQYGAESILCGLMHDASEAYLGDVVSPLKCQPEFEGYRKLELRVNEAIGRALCLPPRFWDRVEVREMDARMCATEAHQVCGVDPLREWRYAPQPVDVVCEHMEAHRVAEKFLCYFAEWNSAWKAVRE